MWVKYLSLKLNVAISAVVRSITIDFSCVTANRGLVQITATPAAFSCSFASSLARLPDERAGLSITRTSTPRAFADTSASSRTGEVNANILTLIELMRAIRQRPHGFDPVLRLHED